MRPPRPRAPDALELTASIGPPAGSTEDEMTVRVGVCWPGDQTRHGRGAPAAAGLPAGAIGHSCGPMDYPDLQAMSGRLPFGLRHYWKGHFLRELDESVISGVVDAMATRPSGHSLLLMEAIRGAAHNEPEGGAAFGQRGAAWNASALAIWEDPELDDAAIAGRATRRTGSGVGSFTGAGLRELRLRSTRRSSGSGSRFGTERFARLARIKAQLRPGQPVPVQPQRRPGWSDRALSSRRGSSVASSGRTSRVSRAPPARATSCWTRSSASPRSRSQRAWRATPRSYSAIAASSG